MKQLIPFILTLLTPCCSIAVSSESSPRLRIGIVGLVHGHAGNFFSKSALTPAGGILHRSDVEIVGIVEPDPDLFNSYARRFHLSASLHYTCIADLVAAQHPQAVLVFTEPTAHREVVEQCARLGVHVMMEKPLATSLADALAIERAAQEGKIHVLVDFETTWYASNTQAVNLAKSGELGSIVKVVFRDGHGGPVKIKVPPEFLSWLVDPKRGGDGALTDFGCYGPSLMTWLMNGQSPLSVTAVTRRLQRDVYPNVDDEAEIILNYPNAVAIVQASWNWPFSVKQMDVYGRTGSAKVIDSERIEIHQDRGDAEETKSDAPALEAPYDDPIHYLAAIISGRLKEGNEPSSLKNNMLVSEILDAARQSSQTGKTVALPLAR